MKSALGPTMRQLNSIYISFSPASWRLSPNGTNRASKGADTNRLTICMCSVRNYPKDFGLVKPLPKRVAFWVVMLEDSNHLREHLRKLYLFMPQTDTCTVEVLLHSLTSALDGGKRSTWRPGKFTRGKNPSTTEQEAGWTLERSAWCKEVKNLLHFPGQVSPILIN